MRQAARRKFWSVVETSWRGEATADRSIRELELETYLPRFRPRPRGGVRQPQPLFDRYLFVRLCPRRGWGDIHRAKGVVRLMGATEDRDAPPCRVDDKDIQSLRDREDALGYVSLETEEPPAFAFREAVVALSGAFTEQRGIYLGSDKDNHRRATILFEMMGREIHASVSRYDLARA